MSRHDVAFKVGGSFLLEVVLRDPYGKPLDLTGAQAVQIAFERRRSGGPAVMQQSMTILNASAPEGHRDRGRVRYLITAADSVALGEGEFEWDVIVDWGDPDPTHHPGGENRLLRLRRPVATK